MLPSLPLPLMCSELDKSKQMVMANPSVKLDDNIKKLRQANFKQDFKQRKNVGGEGCPVRPKQFGFFTHLLSLAQVHAHACVSRHTVDFFQDTPDPTLSCAWAAWHQHPGGQPEP